MATQARRRLSEVGGPDADLVRRCLGGDPQAWADLYLRYRTPLYALVVSWTRDQSLAEDVVHDAFVRAFEQMKSFDIGRRFFPWLATIARNCLNDVYRKSRGHIQVELPKDTGNGWGTDSTVEAVIDLEERSRLHRAIAALPISQRTVFLLAELEGLSYAQIAHSVGASESAVKSLIFRARAMLRQSLKPLAGVVGIGTWLRQRISNGARRASMELARARIDLGVIESASLCIAVAAFVSFPTLSSVGPGQQPIVRESIALAPSPAAEPIDRQASRSQFPLPHSSSTKTTLKASPSITFGQKQAGSAAPSQGRLDVELVSPGGQVIYENSTRFRCDGQGADLLPNRGPVRAVC